MSNEVKPLQYQKESNGSNVTKSFESGEKMEHFNGEVLKSETEIAADEVCERDTDSKIGTDPNFKRRIVWSNVIGFTILHLGALYGLYLVFSSAKYLTTLYAIGLMYMSGMGITIGSHRLWTHRSYQATKSLSTLLMLCQTIAGQNCIWVWSRDHRQHHRYSDTDADPHNATRGFFFSHMGWLMSRKHPLVIKMGKSINMDDLNADSIVMFQKKYYYLLYFIFALYLPVVVPVHYWNESWTTSLFINYFTRYIIILHITWTVNSIAHIYGNKPFDKNILSVQSGFVSLVSLGEGWHNYHHVFPWDYRTAEFGTFLQHNSNLIDAFAYLGLAYNLKEVSPDMIRARAKRTGDDTYEAPINERIR